MSIMSNNHLITNLPQNARVKKFWQSVNIWQRYGQNFVAYFFGATICILTQMCSSGAVLPLDKLLLSRKSRQIAFGY